MRIGLDFDNTIVDYDALFHKVALERGLIPEDLATSKLAVRNHLRAVGQEPVWTEMQGYVYGARMDEAAAYPGVQAFLQWARNAGIDVVIVSHKTRHPFLGPRYDLHAAACGWVERHLVDDAGPLVPPDRAYFELTKEDKWARIAALGCTEFVDDLPEILLAPAFPASVRGVLFDPDDHHAGQTTLERVSSWGALRTVLEQRCLSTR